MNHTHPSPTTPDCAAFAFRLLVALIIGMHGWHRLLDATSPVFGDWLGGEGVPFPYAVAWGVTLGEVIGSACLALGVLVRPFAALFICIYCTGIAMVHAPDGWFVVGPGRNGAEFSVLLIGSLGLVALRIHRPLWESRGQKRLLAST